MDYTTNDYGPLLNDLAHLHDQMVEAGSDNADIVGRAWDAISTLLEGRPV